MVTSGNPLITSALTITGALVPLACAVVEAPDVGWGDVQTLLLLVGSAPLLAAFALTESRQRAPLGADQAATNEQVRVDHPGTERKQR
jgi:hypothetical protein